MSRTRSRDSLNKMCDFKPGLKLLNQVLCFTSITMVLMHTEYGHYKIIYPVPISFFYTKKIFFWGRAKLGSASCYKYLLK